MTSTALVANNLPIPSSAGSLDAYINGVYQIPVLSAEDEQRLAHRLRQDNDIGAAQELILSHLRFVVHVARGYSGYGLQLGDLIQEGNIGLTCSSVAGSTRRRRASTLAVRSCSTRR